MVTVEGPLFFTFDMILIVLLFKVQGVGVGLPVEFREIPTPCLKFYIKFRLCLLLYIVFDLITLCI